MVFLLLLSILPITLSQFVIGAGTYVTFSVASWDLSNGLGPADPPQTVCNETVILEVIKTLNTDVITLQQVDNGTVTCPNDILTSFKTKTLYTNVWYQPLRQYGPNGGTTGNVILSKTPAVTSTSTSGAASTLQQYRYVNPTGTSVTCGSPKDADYCEGAMAIKLQLAPPYSTYGVWIVNTILSNNTQVQTEEAKQLWANFIYPKVNPFLPQPTILTGNFQTPTFDAPALNMFAPLMNNSWLWCGTGNPNNLNYTYPSNYPTYKYQYIYFNGSFLSGSSFSTDQNKFYPSSITCNNNSAYVFFQNNTNYLATFGLASVITFQFQLPSIWAEFLLFTPEELAMLILVPFFSIILFFICVWIAYVCACKKKDDAYNEWKHTPIDDLSTKQGQDMGMNQTRGYQQPPPTRGGGRGGFQEVEEPPRDAPPRGQYDGGYDEEPSTHEPPRRGPPPRGPPARDDYDDYDGRRGGVSASGDRVPPPPRRDGRNVPPPPPRGGGGGYQQREYPDDDGRGPSRGSDRGNSNNRPRAGQLL